MKWLVACGLVLIASQAMSASPKGSVSLYGVTLGQEIPFDYCNSYGLSKTDDMPCFQQSSDYMLPTDPTKLRNGAVVFPNAITPPGLYGDRIDVVMLGDKVVEIEVHTRGLKVQDETYRQLVVKFGQPTRKQTTSKQNNFGAAFEVLSVGWTLAPNTVIFEGALDSIDFGGIKAQTPEAKSVGRAAPVGPRPPAL